jgi:hypothetical protein
MTKSKLTPTDIISTLKNSNVPTIISEGKGDAIVLRRIEDSFSSSGLSVLAAGGRETVLKVFERRSELPNNNLFLFFVDQDFWIYKGVPSHCADDNLFYTEGYSIENDMLRDGELLQFLSLSEKQCFEDELSRFLDWYAVALDRHLADQSLPITTSSHVILDTVNDIIAYLAIVAGEPYPGTMRTRLDEHYCRELRGKSLFGLLNRQLSRVDRPVKIGSYTLLEVGAARSGALMTRITDWVRDRLATHGYVV